MKPAHDGEGLYFMTASVLALSQRFARGTGGIGAMPEGKFFISKLHTTSSGCQGRQESGSYEKTKKQVAAFGAGLSCGVQGVRFDVREYIIVL